MDKPGMSRIKRAIKKTRWIKPAKRMEALRRELGDDMLTRRAFLELPAKQKGHILTIESMTFARDFPNHYQETNSNAR